jgi:hypothetical protein
MHRAGDYVNIEEAAMLFSIGGDLALDTRVHPDPGLLGDNDIKNWRIIRLPDILTFLDGKNPNS